MTILPPLAAQFAVTLGTEPAVVPFLTGWCGMGRTSILLRLRDLLGSGECQYIDVERLATTPERFLKTLVSESPFRGSPHTAPQNVKGPREAFDASLAFLSSACTAAGRPATFLLDEVLDLRTFESFPGLRTVMPDLFSALESSPNRFVLASRFALRASRMAGITRGRFELRPLPRMTPGEVRTALDETPHRLEPHRSEDELARTVHALADGRPCYVRSLLNEMSSMVDSVGPDPIGALVALLGNGGSIATRCRFWYELRLHRARGYGALKAILDVLAEEEPLTLTAISHRLMRTPGSTKDYLGWLEDVDLVVSERKRYRISDPLLRLWIRLQGRSNPPNEDLVVREVQRYAVLALAASARAENALSPQPEASTVGSAPGDLRRTTGIVEFD